MALGMSLEITANGVELPNAYARIGPLVADTSLTSKSVQFTVNIYESAAAYTAGKAPVDARTYRFSPNAEPANPGESPMPTVDQLLAMAVTESGDAVGTSAFAVVRRAIYAWLATRSEWAGAVMV